jgi:hypothetical protein
VRGERHRRLVRLAALVVALAAWPAGALASCTDCLLAGAAAVDITVPAGTPLGGYGSLARRLAFPDVLDRHPHAFWLRPHAGQRDRLRARALVLEAGEGRVVWIAADLVAVDRALTSAVTARLGTDGLRGDVVVSASHTHSGPGAYMKGGLLGALSVDAEDAEVREAVTGALVEAARAAARARRPARVGIGRQPGPDLTVGRLARPVDQDLVVLKVDRVDGTPIAVVWNYAIHGTMLGPKNLELSGDVPGLASLEVERRAGVPALFVNGAVGDVSPRHHGARAMESSARDLAGAVVDLWRRIEAAERGPLRVARAGVELSAPRVSLRNCVGSWVPAGLTLPLGWALPRTAEVLAGAIGTATWVTVPGELQSALGRQLRDGAGARPTLIAGLANDYLGYFLTPADHAAPAYVSCASLYGPAAGEQLVEAGRALLRQLAEAGR